MVVVRACVEVEHMMIEPRLLVRRDHGQVFVALSQELASYASRLGNEADTLADEDPLVPPVRVVQRYVTLLSCWAPVLSDSRIVRLAAAASRTQRSPVGKSCIHAAWTQPAP